MTHTLTIGMFLQEIIIMIKGHTIIKSLISVFVVENKRLRGHSSVGRAVALQASGRRFDLVWLHQLERKKMTDDEIEDMKEEIERLEQENHEYHNALVHLYNVVKCLFLDDFTFLVSRIDKEYFAKTMENAK